MHAWAVRHSRASLGVAFVVLVALAVPELLHRRGYLWGDAADSWLWALRWYGAAGRAGIFADFFPYAFSGFSHGWNVEYGLYNPLYQLCGLLCVDSTFSVRVCFFAQLLAIFLLAREVGLLQRLSPPVAFYVGLATAACGFVTGHAQHLSYIAAVVALLSAYAGLLAAGAGRGRAASLLVGAGVWHGGTAGYPEILLFGAPVLVCIAALMAARRPDSRRPVVWAAFGAACGATLALPALQHAWVGIGLSARADGLSVDAAMDPFGALPIGAVVDLVWPYRQQPVGAADGSMDRFHALVSTTLLLVGGGIALVARRLELSPAARVRLLWLVGLGVLFFVFALGDQSPLPLRRALASLIWLYRTGRFHGAEAQPLALFCLILASAVILEAAIERWPRHVRVAIGLIVVDFVVLVAVTLGPRVNQAAVGSFFGEPLPRLVATPLDQGAVDRPRHCDGATAHVVYQALYHEPRFSTWGYSPLRLSEYEDARRSLEEVLCDGGRLFDAATHGRLDYRLLHYDPVRIEFEVAADVLPQHRRLLWAEVTDGLWQMMVNGRSVPIMVGAGRLRELRIPEELDPPWRVAMAYHGPLSGWWRE